MSVEICGHIGRSMSVHRLVWTNSTAVKLWVGSLSSLLYLKGTDRFFFIHEVIYGSSADLLI